MAAGSVSTHANAMLRTVLHCKPRPVRHHGAGDTRLDRTCVVETGRPNKSAAPIVASGDKFRGGALPVGEMALADLLADRHHDALPADHGAETERDRNRDLHPERE